MGQIVNHLLVFSGLHYYPDGGAKDFAASAGTLEDAQAAARARIEAGDDWAHVAQLDDDGTLSIVWRTN